MEGEAGFRVVNLVRSGSFLLTSRRRWFLSEGDPEWKVELRNFGPTHAFFSSTASEPRPSPPGRDRP